MDGTSAFSTDAFGEDAFEGGYKSPRQTEKAEPMSLRYSYNFLIEALLASAGQ